VGKHKIKVLQSLGQFSINNQKIQDTIKNKSRSWKNDAIKIKLHEYEKLINVLIDSITGNIKRIKPNKKSSYPKLIYE